MVFALILCRLALTTLVGVVSGGGKLNMLHGLRKEARMVWSPSQSKVCLKGRKLFLKVEID